MLQYEAILFCCLVGAAYHRTEAIESVFPNRTKPGLNDNLKLWWAKVITPDYHVAGRLSERQIKYAYEGGFNSVLSLSKHNESGKFGDDYLPTTDEAKSIAMETCGMDFANVLSQNEAWYTTDAVEKLGAALSTLPKPVLLYSDMAKEVTFVLLMHLASSTLKNASFEPKVDSNTFYKMAAVLGMRFTQSTFKKVVSEITGEAVVKDPPKTNSRLAWRQTYWLAHPVYKNWYTAGQMTKAHISMLERDGSILAVINMRPGPVFKNKPRQGEVNLLNIPEETGTYGTGTTKPRQSKERLEETRVDPNKPNSYISPESNVNYESKNEAEFGDDVGYNADLEKVAFNGSRIEYHHFPLGSEGPWDPYIRQNVVKVIKIGLRGVVIVHSATAAKAAILAIIGAAVEHNLSWEWALMKSRDLGFPITRENDPGLFDTMKLLIDNGV